MIRIAISIILLLQATSLFGQGETNIWYFGINAGIDFNSGAPVPILDGALVTGEGCATMCDGDGNLLFYSDGIRAYNRNHQQMPNGFGMTGDPSSAQSALIVPKPGSEDIYYLFTVAGQGDPAGFGYSVVDMSLDGGLGDVIAATKNTQLFTPSCEKVAAVKHANGLYMWIISHAMYSNRYYAYLLDCDGLRPPVTADVGQVEGWPGWGYLTASPDGTKLASAMRTPGFEILDFNPATGVVSNPLLLSSPGEAYGVSFSPDNNLLYGLRIVGGQLYQWNLQAGTPAAVVGSIQTIGIAGGAGGGYRGGAIQQASDGKLYIPHYNEAFLSVINNPNAVGAACGFQNYAVDLLGRGARLGLPPFVQGFLDTAQVIDFSAACYGATTTFDIDGDATYLDSVRWDFGDPASGPLNTSNLLSPSHSYPSSGVYTVTLIRYIDCISDTTVRDINITAPPVTNVDTAICANETYTLPSGLVITEAGTYTDTIPTPIGCDSIVVTSLTVHPMPDLMVIPDTAICVGDPLQLLAIGADSYLWSPATDLSNAAIADPQFTGTAITTYSLTGSTTEGCEVTLQTTVTVHQLPNVSAGTDATICVGDPHQMAATGATDYAWTPTTGLSDATIVNPQFTGTTTTAYTVTGTDMNGCVNTAQKTVTVNPLPIVDAGADVSICIGNTTQLNATGAASYQWSPATGLDNAAIANPTFSSTATQTFTVTGTDVNGCQDTDDVTVTVTALPLVSAGNDTAICIGGTLQLNATGAVSYVWNPATDLSNANIGNPVFSGTQTTVLTVTGTDASGCVNTDDITTTVNSLPIIDAGYDVEICAGQTTPLQAGGAQSYSWTPIVGLNNAGIAAPVFNGTVTTTFTVTGTDANGCSDVDDVTVTVHPLPVAIIDPIAEVCLDFPTLFSHSSTGSITDIEWVPETGTVVTDDSFEHTYSAAGTFTVTLTVTDINGCVHTDEADAVVHPLPAPDMNIQDGADFCEGEVIQFNALNAAGMAQYNWDFDHVPGSPPAQGFSSMESGPQFSYVDFGTYEVRLHVVSSGGCEGEVIRSISVHDVPVADFSFTVACEGELTSFSSLSTVQGGTLVNSWQWDLGDGSGNQSGETVTHGYSEAGTYPVELIVQTNEGCRDTIVQDVWVNPTPAVSISGNDVCLDDEMVFENNSSTQDATIASWTWDFGDSQSAQGVSATHTYAAYGSFNVTLTAVTDSGCTASSGTQVIVHPNPVPAFTVEVTEGCEPLLVPLTDNSTIASGSILSHSWDFGDANSGIGATLNHVYQDTVGIFDVSLTVTSNEGCESTITVQNAVTVNVTPDAHFSQNATILEMPDALLILTDLSQDALTYEWTFGDGDSSEVASPTHRYDDHGEFDIRLTVTNGDCMDIQRSKVTVKPLLTFYIPNAFTPNDNGVNEVFMPEGENFDSYDMQIFNRWGELMFRGGASAGGWDGTFKGSPAPQGQYVYLIMLTRWPGSNLAYSGKLMLVR